MLIQTCELLSAARTRPHALPHAAECPDGAGLPALQEDQACEHQGGGHSRRQPEADSWTHLDYYPALPGQSARFVHV